MTELAARVVPGALARERRLEVCEAVRELLPLGGLQRGTTVATTGSAATSLALALAAGPSAQGSWTAVVGVPGIGLAAATELGVALERLLLVAEPPRRQWSEIVSVAAEGAEVVITRVPSSVHAGELRRVQARLKARGAVLLVVEAGSDPARYSPELVLRSEVPGWEGIGAGHGRLVARRVRVETTGRRIGRPLGADLWLPAADGAVAEAPPPIATLRRPPSFVGRHPSSTARFR